MSQLAQTLTEQPDETNHRTVEIRLVALAEEFSHARTETARAELRYEYRRLHRRWLEIKPAPPSGGNQGP